MTKPSQHRSRDQKEMDKIVLAAVEIGKLSGNAIVGLGMYTAQIANGPKRSAKMLLTTAAQFHMLADSVIELANKIIDWDQGKIVTGFDKTITDAEGKPLTDAEGTSLSK